MVKELKQREVFNLQKVIIYLLIYLFIYLFIQLCTERNNQNGRKERKKKYLRII